MKPCGPCLNCKDRCIDCHSTCEPYLEYRQTLDDYNEKTYRQKELDGDFTNYKQSVYKKVYKR